MPRTTHRKPAWKAKKSYTLSPEEILQAARREAELARINQSISDYYDSLSDEEVQELSEWCDFALSQFPKERA